MRGYDMPCRITLRWEVPGYRRIILGFGVRISPIYHICRLYTGTDIRRACIYGKPVVAELQANQRNADPCNPLFSKSPNAPSVGNMTSMTASTVRLVEQMVRKTLRRT